MVDDAASGDSGYTLRRGDGDAGAGRLFHEGRDTGQELPGRWLEAQYSTPAGALLFVIDDALQEDSLGIYLLDGEHHIRDQARLQRMYATGRLRELRRLEDTQFEFSFFGDDRWALQVRGQPRTGLHLPFPLRELHRENWLGRHWLVLRRLRASSARYAAKAREDRADSADSNNLH